MPLSSTRRRTRVVSVLGVVAALGLTVSCGGGSRRQQTAGYVAPSLVSHVIPAAQKRIVASDDPVIAAAGDIACDADDEAAAIAYNDTTQCQEQKTAALLQDPSIGSVLALGDDQYYSGDLSQFSTMYGQSWGTVLNKTFPVPGNHEYYGTNTNAEGYFAYFGARAGTPGKGWYSFDLGAWHLIALNTGYCPPIGGCSPAFSGHPASPEYTWLVNDLAKHPNQCILAYWHQPVFSGGGEGGTKALGGLFSALYNAQADVVLNGHDHDYERFAQQDSLGNAAPGRGIREFVVGTGGRSHEDFLTNAPNTEVRFNDSFGVLRMTLHPTSYDWQFEDAAGSTSGDSGTDTCHVVKPTVVAPATVLRGTPLTVTGTGRVLTPVTLQVSNAKGSRVVLLHPDASGAWTTTLSTTPDGGTYRLVATSGTQTSTVVTSTMTGTTVTGPASAARGGHVVLSGLAQPGKAVTVYVTRPAATPLGFKTVAGPGGTYTVSVPVDADAGWYAVSNSFRTPKGHTSVHGLTVSGPASVGLKKPLTITGLAAPHAKVTVFTRSYHGKSAIGHAVLADAHGVYKVKLAFGISSTWWAVSGGVRSPIHTTKIPAPPKPS
jgi:acid phosphatase type 7